MSKPHKTTTVLVPIDVDEGIAESVKWLNDIPGIRTHASCQGTIGEGGAEPYGPYVEITWEDASPGYAAASQRFDIVARGLNWGHAYPKDVAHG